MRRSMIYVCTAALVFTAVMPGTAMAANVIVSSAGIGQKVVIGGDFTQERLPGIQIEAGELAGIVLPDSECSISAVIGSNGAVISGSNGAGQQRPGQGSSDSSASDDQMARQVAELVNQERAKAGLPSLSWSAEAASAAQVRAAELTASFSHSRPDGSHFTTALTEAGVRYSSSGENIASGQSSAEKVMEQWMNSSGHRANILSTNYTSIGVGHYVSPSGVHYWTQLFYK